MVRQETDPKRCPPGGRDAGKLQPLLPATQRSRMVAQGQRLHSGHTEYLGMLLRWSQQGAGFVAGESVGRQTNTCSLYCSEEISQLRSAHMKP